MARNQLVPCFSHALDVIGAGSGHRETPTVAALATVASLLLSACASTSGMVADNIPAWLGGMPNDVPPRRGTVEYDEWQRKRAEEAAKIKSK